MTEFHKQSFPTEHSRTASSYLLIGFYYTKPSAVSASKKAFIVTRFADLGFLIGILVLSFYTGTFDFTNFTSTGVEGMANVYQVDLTTAEGIRNWIASSPAPVFMGGSGSLMGLPVVWLTS